MRVTRSVFLIVVLGLFPLLVACSRNSSTPAATAARSTAGTAAMATAVTATAPSAAASATPPTTTASVAQAPTASAPLRATPTASAPTPVATTAPTPTPVPTPTPAPTAPSGPPQAHPVAGGRITLPAGFAIGLFAQGLGRARFMAVRPADGTLFVADEAGRVLALPDAHHHGQADQVAVVAQGLDHPSSLAFFGDWLYVGETARITRLHLPPNGLTPDAQEVVVPNLPADGEHLTRTVVIGPDARLYIGVGSSCNVCVEADPHRAAILVANLDGSALQVYASGLRNAVGLAFAPGTTQLWATVNGRDNLGDHLPPDDLRQISPGGFYGWPYCYDGPHPNPEFNDPARCAGVPPDELALPAHVAPLGLSFGQGLQAPVAYQQSLYIAEHGSWNSSVPVGYQLLRVPLVQGGLGEPVVFASGWLPSGGGAGAVWGRPVGVTVGSDGALYVSDDANGVIYRIVFTG